MDNSQQRFDRLTPLQKRILFKLMHKVEYCEGFDIPGEYWCKSCVATWDRMNNLLIRFELMNIRSTLTRKTSTSTGHPGFR